MLACTKWRLLVASVDIVLLIQQIVLVESLRCRVHKVTCLVEHKMYTWSTCIVYMYKDVVPLDTVLQSSSCTVMYE